MLKALSSSRKDFKKGELPDRIVVLPWGVSEIDDGETLTVGEKTLAEFSANQKRLNFDRVALDFEHQTVKGSPNYKPDPVKVAAFGVPRLIEGEGIVLEELEWTDTGKQFIGGRHYCDISPVIKHDTEGNVIFLHSAGACRQGQVRGLKLFSAADPFTTNDNSMDYKKILTAMLGLGDEATDEQIQTGATSLAEKLEGMKAMAAKLESLEGRLSAFSATPAKLDDEQAASLKVLTTKVDTLDEGIKALTARNEELEREGITREALSQGKVIPASAKDLPLKNFKALVAELPEDQVPLSKRTPDGLKEFTASKPDNGVKALCAQLGISEEDYKKHNS